MYIGIAMVASPKAFSEVGFVAGITGLIFVGCISLGAAYFLLKARNRYKKLKIVDFSDLGEATYGPKMKVFCQAVLLLASASFLMAQGMYLGGQVDLLACDILDRPSECGKNKKFYAFVSVALLSPILLLPDFKKLSVASTIFVTCCFVSIVCIFLFNFQAIYFRTNGIEQEMTLADENGVVSVATAEQKASAYDFEYFDAKHLPMYLGEIMAIFEGNAGILNLYS
jgi:amino acid permease